MRAYHPLLILGLSVLIGCESITGALGSDNEPRFAAIYTGPVQACGLTASGETWCWGTVEDGLRYERVPIRLRFKGLGLGSGGQCGLKAAGELYCTDPSSWIFAQRFPERRFAQIARSTGHSNCALGVDGEALCWGRLYNFCDAASCADLRVISTAEPLIHIASGNWVDDSEDPLPYYRGHACGLSATGTAYCWGENGHEGAGAPITGFGFIAIDTGKRDTCALDGEGIAYCWGAMFGPTPTRVTDISFSAISLGGDDACGLTPDGDVYCWGGTSGDPRLPARVPGGLEMAAISVSPQRYYEPRGSACGLTSEGEAYCWFLDDAGELGVPVRVTKREKTNIIYN